MDIVKVGGSVCRPEWQDALVDWLEARMALAPLVVVCGGGAQADLVRSEQHRLGFDHLTAHRQALLAMEQQAWWLHGVWARRHGRRCAVSADGEPGTLWTPRDLIEDPGDIEVSWSVTSDSLAAWLAGRRPTETLWLLKAVDVIAATGTPADWVTAGWVDPSFPTYLGRAGCAVRLLGPPAWAQGLDKAASCAQS
jgi:aspartokinase-like uncharacterized kinase